MNAKFRMFVILAGAMLFALGCGGGSNSSGGSVRSILFLAQVKSSGETSDVFIANGDGTNVRQLTHLTDIQTADDACFSPDGKTVLYTLHNLPHSSAANPQQTVSSLDIHAMNTDGTNDHLFVKDQTLRGYNIAPRFNAAGTKAIFIGSAYGGPSALTDTGQLLAAGAYTVNPDGSGAQRFADLPPEGGQVFIYNDFQGGSDLRINPDFDLYSFYALTGTSSVGNPVPSTSAQMIPWWSYNVASNRIVYTEYTSQKGYQLFVSEPQRAHPVAIASVAGEPSHSGSPRFSHDGRKIVFTGLNAAGHAGDANASAVCVINADGSGLTQLTHSGNFVEFQDLY